METTRIAVVDRQEVVREGLVRLLSEYNDFDIVGQGKDFASARHICSVYNPHLLITDFIEENAGCIQTLQKLQQEFPHIQLFILTSQKDARIINETLQLGVIGYWFKNSNIGELVKAIREIKKGHPSLAPEVLRSILHTIKSPNKGEYNLTSRELEVLNLMVDAYSNREIGEKLYISYSTVKNHVSKILSKLNVSNRVEAVTLALDEKIIERSEV